MDGAVVASVVLVAIIAGAGACLWLMVSGLRSRTDRVRRLLGGSAGLVVLVTLVGLGLKYAAGHDLNPSVQAAELLGRWHRDGTVLTVRTDSSYTCESPAPTSSYCAPSGIGGRWQFNGSFDIHLLPHANTLTRLRTVNRNEQRQLIPYNGDDGYDWRDGFVRMP